MAVLVLAVLLGTSGGSAQAQQEAPPSVEAEAPVVAHGPQPFGSNLFTGNFAAQREDGINPDYQILPGDRVMVNAWGALTINEVFTVDSQGNIFLPGIGPVRLAGVRNENLTNVVEAAISRTYRGNFGVYTNLLTTSPVAVFVTGGVRRPWGRCPGQTSARCPGRASARCPGRASARPDRASARCPKRASPPPPWPCSRSRPS